jgi:hypothetical protein
MDEITRIGSCWEGSAKNYASACVFREIVFSERLCFQRDCVFREIVFSERLCIQRGCVFREVVFSERLCNSDSSAVSEFTRGQLLQQPTESTVALPHCFG